MPSDSPAPGAPPAAKVDFSSVMANVKAIAAKHGIAASVAQPPVAAHTLTAASGYGAPPPKRPYEDDSSYGRHDDREDDGYGKRMAYDSGRDSAPIHRPGLGAQISHYAPPMRNEHSIQEEMGVPGNLVGLIIGRGGENLKRIERETGCRVQVSQDGNPGDRERFINIIGQPAGIADARRQIQEIVVSSQSGDRGGSYGGGGYGPGGGGGGGQYGMGGGYGRNSSSIQIPSAKVGLVIGRGGETIRDLQERSGARIAVTPSPQDHDSTTRTVTLTGDDQAIDRAKTLIEEIVNDLAPRGGYGGGGFQNTPPVTMTVPQESIGLVIGRGGETVKQLQIQSRAKIQVQQIEHGMPPPADRTINLFGPPEAVEYAKQLIMEKVSGSMVAHDITSEGIIASNTGATLGSDGYGGSAGGYGGYQQQQYGQSGPSSASGGYGQYGSYGAPAPVAAAAAVPAAAAATGYTPEQQAAYAQYYGYQYNPAYPYGAAPSTSTAPSTAAPGADTSAASSAAAPSYGAYYGAAAYGAVAAATSAAPAAPASAATTTTTTGADVTATTTSAALSSSTAPTTDSATAAAAMPDYSAYYAQQGYSAEAYQQYYSQYYGYQQPAATGTTEAAAGTTTAPADGSSITAATTDTPALTAEGTEGASSTIESAPAPATDATAESTDAAPASAEDK
ncbi:hypothetical protein BGZ83_005538 [Gryganskiella cystojenkinii]|nr:hypothetical protein BGZ83_005538 [Gryganskiella cystojenkinii]